MNLVKTHTDNRQDKSKGHHIHEESNELEVSQTLTNKGGPNVKNNGVSGVEPFQRTRWNKVHHRGVVRNSRFFSDGDFANHLCFTVSIQFNFATKRLLFFVRRVGLSGALPRVGPVS